MRSVHQHRGALSLTLTLSLARPRCIRQRGALRTLLVDASVTCTRCTAPREGVQALWFLYVSARARQINSSPCTRRMRFSSERVFPRPGPRAPEGRAFLFALARYPLDPEVARIHVV